MFFMIKVTYLPNIDDTKAKSIFDFLMILQWKRTVNTTMEAIATKFVC